MFSSIGEKTLYIFGIANIIAIPMVWALYPESNQRTLEQIDLLFAASSPWNWDAEKKFKELAESNPGLTRAARVRENPGEWKAASLEIGMDTEKATSEHV